MNYFTISDIEHLTGIKAHTLRVWEQRYRVGATKRKESGHRFYDDDDLRHLLRIGLLYNNGYRISQLARLREDQLLVLTAGLYSQSLHEQFVHQLMDAGKAFDEEHFEKILHLVDLHLGFEKCITEVVYPFLEKLGMLWLTDQVVPAQEHFCSNLIRKKLLLGINSLDPVKSGGGRRVLLFTPPGEAHEIPLLYIQYLLKKYGSITIYMGAEVSLKTLEDYYSCHKPTHLLLHLITHLGNFELPAYLEQLGRQLPGVKLVVSGPAFSGLEKELPANVKCLHSMTEMTAFAKGH